MRWLERVTARPGRRTVPTGPRVAVVTDSAAAFPCDWLTASGPAAGVTVVSMPVMISGRIFGEGSDDLTEPLTVALAEGAEIRTSRPSPGHFENVYRRLQGEGFDEILSVHLSGKLSGTVDAARWAAGVVSIPVQVIDSGTVGMALGFGVTAAAYALGSGGTPGEAAAAALETCRASSVFFYVPSLEQLRRGGRIGAAASVLGTLLAVKPILTVEDGLIVPLERVRTASKALQRLADLVDDDLSKRPAGSIAAFHYFGNRPQATEASARTAQGARHPQVVVTRLPAVLAAHTGLGVLAVATADPPAHLRSTNS